MSLINEALRKARLEAARQDAARRGISYPSGDAAPRRLPVKTLASAVFVVALVGAVLYWLGARSAQSDATLTTAAVDAGAVDTEDAGDSSTLAASATPPVTNAATAARMPPVARPAATRPKPPATTAGGQSTGAAPAAPAAKSRPTPPPAVAATPPAPRPAAAAPEPAIENSAPPPDPVRQEDRPPRQPSENRAIAAPPTAAADPAPAAAETFVGEATIPGAGTLRLGGIAWSERQPFALINGRVVGPGDQIEGLQVDSVGRAEVVLRADGGTTYVLRLR